MLAFPLHLSRNALPLARAEDFTALQRAFGLLRERLQLFDPTLHVNPLDDHHFVPRCHLRFLQFAHFAYF